jgi:tetratricopeptide (TPR) repeat protein
LGREDEAIVALERAAQLEPRSPDPSFELGKIYKSKQDWPNARKAFEHVVELNPQFAPAHYQLSQVYAHLGLQADAQKEAQQTQTLVKTQRDEVLRKQRKRAGSFQPQIAATPAP